MFEGRNNSYNPLAPKHYPIYGGKVNVYASVFDYYNPLREINRHTLREIALKAMADRGLLSGKRIARSEYASPLDPQPEKEFTVQIYGEDIDNRYGKRVMFANEQDLNTVMAFLEEKVGKERMEVLRRSINPQPDEVAEIGYYWLNKWRTSDEEWPLAAKQ